MASTRSKKYKTYQSAYIVISLAATQGWPLFQFGVKNAFLHDDL